MKNLLLSCLALIFLLVSGNTIAAQSEASNKSFEYADAKIKQEIHSDFLFNYADTLDSVEDFQSNTSLSYHSAQLGEGIAFYRLEVKENSTSTQFAGYKFPLYLDNQQVGVIDAIYESGMWKVLKISNDNQFERKLEQIKAKSTESAKLKLIDDKRYKTDSAYISDTAGERFIDLNTDKVITKTEFDQKINSTITNQANAKFSENEAIPLGYGESPISTAGPNILMSLIFLALAIGFAISFIFVIHKHKKETVHL